MTKQEIIKQCTKGVVIDADNFDDIYTVFDADKIVELTQKNTIEQVCEWLKEHIINTVEFIDDDIIETLSIDNITEKLINNLI